jgi:hypothetical protein
MDDLTLGTQDEMMYVCNTHTGDWKEVEWQS